MSWTSIFGGSQIPRYIQDFDRNSAQYRQEQLDGVRQNLANARAAGELGPESDFGYSTAMGAWLNGNPYLNNMASDVAQQIAGSYNSSYVPQALSSYASSGRFGSGLMQKNLAGIQGQMNGDIGSAVSKLYSDNYNTERGYMQEAQNRIAQQYDPLQRYAQYGTILNQYTPGVQGNYDTAGILEKASDIFNGLKLFFK